MSEWDSVFVCMSKVVHYLCVLLHVYLRMSVYVCTGQRVCERERERVLHNFICVVLYTFHVVNHVYITMYK